MTEKSYLFHICLLLLTILIQSRSTVGIVAYDCSSQNVTMKSISLVSDTPCSIPPMVKSPSPVRLQVLQRTETTKVRVYQCKVTVDWLITNCGMHSHSSVVRNGYGRRVRTIGRKACLDAHNEKSFTFFPGFELTSLNLNGTSHRSLILAGSLSSDGKCNGGSFHDEIGDWESAIVQAIVEVSLYDYTAPMRFSDKSIILNGGLSCTTSSDACIDSQYGETYWTINPYPRCEDYEAVVRYEGPASLLMTDARDGSADNETSYIIKSQGLSLWLTITGTDTVCGHTVETTDHPRILVMQYTNNNQMFHNHELSATDFDIISYVNAKFLKYDKDLKVQLDKMYAELAYQRCKVEAQVLQNLMSTAIRDPVQFARDYMQVPGYTGVRRNEVIHVIKCRAVDHPIWYSEVCYDELPLNQSGSLVFMSPRTHIIQSHGTEVSCNPILSGGFRLGSSWYSFNPSRMLQVTPEDLTPQPTKNWHYISPEGLGTNGLYTQDELENLRRDILFPSTRSAVQNNLIRGSLGYPTNHIGANLGNVLDSSSIEKIASRVWNKAWGWFTTIGEWSSGFLGLYLIWILLKFVFNAIINALTLYELYGFSYRLFAAVKTSLTMLCINKARTTEVSVGDKVEESPVNASAPDPPTPPPVYPLLTEPQQNGSLPPVARARYFDDVPSRV